MNDPLLCHPRRPVAMLHWVGIQDGFPIQDVGNDKFLFRHSLRWLAGIHPNGLKMDSRSHMPGMTAPGRDCRETMPGMTAWGRDVSHTQIGMMNEEESTHAE